MYHLSCSLSAVFFLVLMNGAGLIAPESGTEVFKCNFVEWLKCGLLSPSIFGCPTGGILKGPDF